MSVVKTLKPSKCTDLTLHQATSPHIPLTPNVLRKGSPNPSRRYCTCTVTINLKLEHCLLVQVSGYVNFKTNLFNSCFPFKYLPRVDDVLSLSEFSNSLIIYRDNYKGYQYHEGGLEMQSNYQKFGELYAASHWIPSRIINDLRSHVKHSKQCFIWFPNKSKLI